MFETNDITFSLLMKVLVLESSWNKHNIVTYLFDIQTTTKNFVSFMKFVSNIYQHFRFLYNFSPRIVLRKGLYIAYSLIDRSDLGNVEIYPTGCNFIVWWGMIGKLVYEDINRFYAALSIKVKSVLYTFFAHWFFGRYIM